MAHGAPDHTRLADDAYSHYRDVWGYFPWGILAAADPGNYIVNKTGIGVLGDVYVLVDSALVKLKIVIDGVNVYSWDANTLKSLGLWGYSNNQFKMSVTMFDAVIGLYAFMFSGNNGMYFHKSLQVYLARSAPLDLGTGYCWYKEKI